jgi:hypothetical protein
MARAFLHEGGRYVAILDDTERTVLSGLMQQTRILLSPEVESTGDVFDDLAASMGVSLDREAEATAAAGDPDVVELRDPALDRLLPDAHRGDDDIAAEFRRLTEEGLRQRKSSNLDVALARLAESVKDRVELGPDDAPAFLMALTDVRLLLGERMGMRTEEDAEALHRAMELIDDDDPLGYAMAWYDFLTWLQETLTHALMGTDLSDVGTTFADDDAWDDESDHGSDYGSDGDPDGGDGDRRGGDTRGM